MNTNTEIIAAVIGFFMPLLIGFLKQDGFPRIANLIISIAACVGAALLVVWGRGELHWTPILATIAVMIFTTQAMYAAYFANAPALVTFSQKSSIVKA